MLRFFMKTRTLMSRGAVVLACLAPLSLFAADWPQWQGPDRTNVSKETGLLKSWPEGGPKLLWTFDQAGTGYSGPAIVGDRLYTLGGDGKKEFVFALDLKTQDKVWSTDVGRFFPHGNGDGPRGTPTVDGDVLFCLTGHGELLCVETAGGKIRWQKNLKKAPKDGGLGGKMASGWGYSESVLVDGDKVVCTPGGEYGALAALDKKTGDVLWRSKELKDPAVYSSIVTADIGGVRQYVQVTGKGVAGVAAADGKLLWHSNQNAHGISVTTPLVAGNKVYVTTGYRVGCGLLDIESTSDGFTAKKVYGERSDETKLMVNHHGGVVLVGKHVYGYSDSNGWVCQELATGKRVWNYQKGDFGKGSLTCADGRLYCYTENGGKVALVEAAPTNWNPTGQFTIPQRSRQNRPNKTWTHPVVANGKLYLRDQEYLFCYDIKDGGR
jgi:outer membrane protein assembly factor BamB